MISKLSPLFLFLLIFNFTLLAQTRTSGDHDNQGRRIGIWKKYYGNKLDTEITYKSGIKEGTFKTYWRSGTIFQIGQYQADKRTGQWTLYHENKTIKEQGRYLNGQKIGSWKYYNERGTLRSITNYLNGKKSGLYQSFWKDGVPDEKGNYLIDKKVGEWIKYDYKRETSESFLKYKGSYDKNGDKIGRWEEYRYLTNELKKLETFNDQGVLNGPFAEYNYSGKLIAKGDMLNAKRNGNWTLVEDDGEYKISVTYTSGVKNGPYEKRSRSSLVEKGNYSYDLKDGLWEEVDFSGVRGKGKYASNKKVGLWEFYHPQVKSHPVLVLNFSNDGTELSRKQYNEQNILILDISSQSAGTTKSYKAYYPDGKLKVAGQLKNDKQEGLWNEYYPQGVVATFKNFKDGAMDGEFKQLFPNGDVKIRLNFSAGKVWNLLELNDINGNSLDGGTLKNGNGTLIVYDDNGKLQQVQNFVNGQLQK